MRKGIDSWALKVLTTADQLRLPVDIVKVARSQGIAIYETKKLPGDIIGAAKWSSDNNEYQILVTKESKENYSEERYRMALLIAECIINGNKLKRFNKIFTLERNMIPDEEIAALADALLMEKNIFIDLYKIRPDLKELSKVFYVTVSRVTKRAIDLKLL